MKLKIVLPVLLLFISESRMNAQDFDTQLEAMAQALAEKIDSKNITKVAVWGFLSEDNQQNDFGNFLTDDFSIYLVNHSESFAVIERNHLNVIL